ncbi:unnamed protein product [Microthlaspi erraticum]|uniref:Uncharacterized protein n=1 Tax=Microthlaspi erraticum TaxID=1685480 RepID=A0A6D2K5K6_9BRAS|nr:unnamed protein product [Microthlaspi erraticum]
MLIADVLCRASTRKASTSVPEGVPEQVIELDSPPSSDHDESSHHDESASHHDDGLRTPARGGSPSKGFSLARRTKLRKFGRARRSSRRPKVTILIWKDRYLSHASRRSGMKPFGSTMRPRLIFYRDMSGKRVNEAHGGFGVSNGPSSSAKGLDRIEKRPG